MQPTEPRTVRKNALSGLRIGLAMATAFSIWATLIRAAIGPGAFERFGLTWVETVVLYYAALSVGGMAAGAVDSLRRYAWGAMLQGFLLMLPLYGAVVVAIGLSLGKIPSVKVGLAIGLILATLGGGAFGILTWLDEDEGQNPTGSDN